MAIDTPNHHTRLNGSRLWAALALLAAATWGFIEVAEEVLDGDAHAIDRMILQWCRVEGQPGMPWGPVWFQESVRDVTALGSPAVLITVLTLTCLQLFLKGERLLAWFAAATAGGGLLMAVWLKSLFSRDRPDLIFHATVANGYSFPSGHAMMSTVVFLTLGVLMARLTERRILQWHALGSAMLLSGLTGLSRIYLGVHWASDVVAGWAAGAAWAIACWLLAQHFQLRRQQA